MPNEKRNYVAVLPDNREIPFELTSDGRGRGNDLFDIKQKIDRIVADAGVKTPRANPKRISVRCFRLIIKGTELQRHFCYAVEVMPPYDRLTPDQFATEQETLLASLPPEFHDNVRTEAWDDGHSAGFEEVISILKSYIRMIEDPLNAYTERIKKQYGNDNTSPAP